MEFSNHTAPRKISVDTAHSDPGGLGRQPYSSRGIWRHRSGTYLGSPATGEAPLPKKKKQCKRRTCFPQGSVTPPSGPKWLETRGLLLIFQKKNFSGGSRPPKPKTSQSPPPPGGVKHRLSDGMAWGDREEEPGRQRGGQHGGTGAEALGERGGGQTE